MPPPLEDDEEMLCDVCSENIVYFSIGKCDHPICYKCATRMRVLCNHTYCPICRADLPKVVYCRKLCEFRKVNTSHYPVNRKQKIYFEDGGVQDAYYDLLQHTCQLCDRQKFSGLRALQTHLKREHELFYCDLCVKHLKVFSHERKTYSRQDLARHRRVGDADDKSHKGHPLCEFCDERYLDNDELAKHLRKDHFYCHFCDADGLHHYYINYNVLRDHFREEHFLCEEGDCHDVQFTNAFRDKIDFQAHVSQNHGKGMKKAQSRQQRTLEIEFNLAPWSRDRGVITGLDYEDNDSSKRGRGRGRGHKRDIGQEEREEKALSEALAASCVEFDAKREYKEKADDFPSLQQESLALAPSGQSAESMAKTFARNNKISVQEGSMTPEDFPALGGGASSTKQSYLPPKQQAWSNLSPAMANQNVQPTRSAGRGNGGDVSDSACAALGDFPTLKSSRKQNTIPQTANQGPPSQGGKSNVKSAVAKAVNAEEDFPSLGVTSRSQNKIQIVAPDQPKKSSRKQGLKSTFSSEEDFPTLGNSSGVGSAVVPTGFSLASVVGGKKQTLGELARGISPSYEKPSLNLKGDKDFPSLGVKSVVDEVPEWKAVTKKQNKPKKMPKTERSEVKDQVPIPGAIFKDSDKVRKTVESNKSCGGARTAEVQEKKKRKKKIKSDKNASNDDTVFVQDNDKQSEPVNDNEITEERDVKAEMANGIAEREGSAKASNSEDAGQSDKENFTYPFSDNVLLGNSGDITGPQFVMDDGDFPILAKPEKKSVSFGLSYSSDEQSPQTDLKIDISSLAGFQTFVKDFPSLSTISKSLSKAPPGMAPPVSSKPPGLPTSNLFSPPPGLGVIPPNFEGFIDASSQLNHNSNVNSKTVSAPPGLNSGVVGHVYYHPNNFERRNADLIGLLGDCVKHDDVKFGKFKACSGQYRQNTITADKYYQTCRDLLGDIAFATIFPELLVLLPDIKKQQQLLSAHWQANSSGLELGVKSCPTCRQVVAKPDLQSHVAVHRLDDFPSLGAGDNMSHSLKQGVQST